MWTMWKEVPSLSNPEAPEQLLRTRDFDEAKEHITSIYIPHELRSRDNHSLDFKIRYLASKKLTIGHLRYGADSELLVPPMESCYHVNLTLHGETHVTQSGKSAFTKTGQSGAIFNPVDPFTVRWSPEAIQYAIKIPRSSLEGQLSALIGRPIDKPIDFDLGFDLTKAWGQSLLAAVTHMRNELSRDGGLVEAPLVRAQLESYVLSQLLMVIPHDYRSLIYATGQNVSRRHIQVAMDHIEEHLMEPLTGPDIAVAAHVSIRALQVGFLEELGLSPMSYVRSRRLDRVHEELMRGTGVGTINDIASRWGFSHFGRFADQYRRKFGVLPSETVRLTRREPA